MKYHHCSFLLKELNIKVNKMVCVNFKVFLVVPTKAVRAEGLEPDSLYSDSTLLLTTCVSLAINSSVPQLLQL